MDVESRPVLTAKRLKNRVVGWLPVRQRILARDLYHRLRLRVGYNPLGKPDEHRRFLETHCAQLFDGAPRPLVYAEFGVYQGASMAAAVQAFENLGIVAGSRFVGFDSFEGLPTGSEAEGWGSGWFVTSRRTAEWNLRRLGAADRAELVEGWFDDTCTPQQAADLGRVDVVMMDCDVYSATATALAFVEPIMNDPCLVIFDDWLAYNGDESDDFGQVKAWKEIAERHGDLRAERLGRVGHCGVGFLVRRETTAAAASASTPAASDAPVASPRVG